MLLALTALFWGGNFVMGRGVAGHVPPISLAFLRWSIATLIILPFAWPHLRRELAVVRQHWPILFFLAATGGGSFNTLTYIGLNHTTALNALVLNSAAPVLIALACYLLFRDRVSGLQGVGIVISLAGVLTVISKGALDVLLSLKPNAGDLWVLGAMLIWAVYTAFLRQRPRVHWLVFAFVLYFLSAAVNLPFFVGELIAGAELHLTWTTVLAVGYVSVFPSVLAYLFYNRGVELIGGTRAGVFMHLIPLFGAIFAIGFLGETLAPYHGVGFALIVVGVTLAARSPSATRTS